MSKTPKIRFHSQSFQKDPSFTRTIRRTYERKVARLFFSFRHKALETMSERTFESPSVSRISFTDLSDSIIYLIGSEITAPGESLIAQMVQESLKAGKHRAGAFLRSVGVTASFGEISVDPRVYEIIKERNIAALKGITDEMSKTIKAQLSEGIVKGEPMRKLAKRVSESTGVPIQRARTMARTETMFAFNTAKDEEFRKYGVEKVEWVAALDERMCPVCGKLHGKVFEIDQCPPCPAHPNCLIDGQYPILTSKGWMPISNISVGDLVLTHNGRFRPVAQTFKIPDQRTEITRIKVRSGIGQPNILSLTPDHPVLISGSWVAAKDVKPGDNIAFLAGECDGTAWHNEEHDSKRQNFIESQGWTFLRYSDSQIKNDLFGCVNEVSRVLANHEGDYHFINAPVVGVETFQPKRTKTLWNLSVSEDESFVAKGFVVHNCRCVTIPYIDVEVD